MAANWNRNALQTVVAFTLIALVAGQDQQEKQPSTDPILVNSKNNLYEGSQKFALNLFKHVVKRVEDHGEVKTKNIIMSPLSVWTLLALLSEGAEGETLHEILNVMNVQNQSLIRHKFKEMQQTTNVNSSGLEILSAQFMFTNKNQPVKQDFEHSIHTFYGDQLFEALDFSSSGAAIKMSYDHINKVVSDATKGQIARAVYPTDVKDARLLLLSVLFFQGDWTFPFNRSLTTDAPFYNENEQIVATVPMMFQKAVFPFAAFRELQAQIVELPYGSDRHLSMLVILPRKGVALQEIVARLADFSMEEIYRELKQVAEEYEDDEVEVYLPQFQITNDLYLDSPLYDMGIRLALNKGAAQFNKIADDIFVNTVIQKSKIVVNEEGTTAAASTAAIFVNKATPPRFIANRPFAFLIVDKRTNQILYMGQVKNPMDR
ncbi:serine protease inhibitor 77Ba-like isoform X2 [Ochlerotatus camptorhynchus]|uniref:serine protease inhibitor 77Ba-like isoform X2 n=1 Tax=Ochlerotatus camptorhynchus TaxID=644619 RepID=UPI0031D6820D